MYPVKAAQLLQRVSEGGVLERRQRAAFIGALQQGTKRTETLRSLLLPQRFGSYDDVRRRAEGGCFF
jgi:hypothetical protein